MDIKKKNKFRWNKVYSKTDKSDLINKIANFDSFLDEATIADISWSGMYWGDLRHQLKGKKVLELGCGDGLNACIMERLGATVIANDVSDESGKLIQELKNKTACKNIEFLSDDFLNLHFAENDFDYVVGKSFLHHLTEEMESDFFKKILKILKPAGEARFFEPAVNSKVFDYLRYLIPVKGRPSILQKKAFKKWKELDVHPNRNNSSRHYSTFGKRFFNEVIIIPLGCLEKFHRILFTKNFQFNRKLRKLALKSENFLPHFLRSYFARSQTIIYREPKNK